MSEGYMDKRYPEFMKKVRAQDVECKKLKAENKKLRACVEYYSYEGLYNWYHDKDDNFAVTTDIEKDMGETARQVLKDIESK